MIVLPQTADHHVVARQVESSGAGIVLDRSRVTPQALIELTTRVLEDTRFATQSARMGESLRAAGGPVHAPDQILAFHVRTEAQ